MASEAEYRTARPEDADEIIGLLATMMGKELDDRYRRFLRWKHEENPFGPSPAWVAVLDGELVGYRTFLRWRFVDADGEAVSALRAVDTATHPRAQGRGIFKALTLAAVDELTAEGFAFVFNTPNDKSRPGYLKMGWRSAGRLPALFRPVGLSGLVRTARSRVPADIWSEPTSAGVTAVEAFADDAATSELLDGWAPSGLSTARSAPFLRWRYGNPDLCYRAVMVGADAADGVAVFRIRRRGTAREAVVCDVLARGDRRAAGRLLDSIRRQSGADHVLRLPSADLPRSGYLPLPGGGPELVWRPLTWTDDEPSWQLTMGDVELF